MKLNNWQRSAIHREYLSLWNSFFKTAARIEYRIGSITGDDKVLINRASNLASLMLEETLLVGGAIAGLSDKELIKIAEDLGATSFADVCESPDQEVSCE